MDLKDMITQPESQIFDRKSSNIEPKKIAETIIAFSNADGGKILVGVDDGKIIGFNHLTNVKKNDFVQSAIDLTIPTVKMSHEFIPVINYKGEADEVLILDISSSAEVVHANTKDEAFLRVGDETKRLTHDQRLQLEYEKGSRKYEENLVRNFESEDVNWNVVKKYHDVIGSKREDLEKFLLKKQFAEKVNGEIKYTVAGVLLFGEIPSDFIPSSRIRFFRYEGIEKYTGTRMNMIKQAEFEGPLSIQIEDFIRFLRTQVKEFTALDKNTGLFRTEAEYPEFTWKEGVINAVAHRAYSNTGDAIRISMFDDRIEISSPGRLPSLVTLDNIQNTRFSRNPMIARTLTELGYVREQNEGVERIYDEMKVAGLPQPEYRETAGALILTLRNVGKKNLNDNI